MGRRKSGFITVGFIIVAIILRFVAELASVAIPIVAVINSLMIAYVFYCVDQNVSEFLKKRDSNQILAKQYLLYKKHKKIVIGLIFILLLFYIIVEILLITSNAIGGCINDCMAIVTFGLSLEDDVIEEWIIKYYKEKNYLI